MVVSGGCGSRPVMGLGGQRPGGGGIKYDQAQGRGRNSPSLLGRSTHGRKVQFGDVLKIPPQGLPRAQPAELYVEVPENYGGNFPLYLTKVSLRADWVGCPPPGPASSTSSLPFSSLLWLSREYVV